MTCLRVTGFDESNKRKPEWVEFNNKQARKGKLLKTRGRLAGGATRRPQAGAAALEAGERAGVAGFRERKTKQTNKTHPPPSILCLALVWSVQKKAAL